MSITLSSLNPLMIKLTDHPDEDVGLVCRLYSEFYRDCQDKALQYAAPDAMYLVSSFGFTDFNGVSEVNTVVPEGYFNVVYPILFKDIDKAENDVIFEIDGSKVLTVDRLHEMRKHLATAWRELTPYVGARTLEFIESEHYLASCLAAGTILEYADEMIEKAWEPAFA